MSRLGKGCVRLSFYLVIYFSNLTPSLTGRGFAFLQNYSFFKDTMKIQSAKQLDKLRTLIGEQNVTGCKKALKDGVAIWVFKSAREVKVESALNPQEKKFCLDRLASGEKWAGIFRRPEPIYEPGVTYSPDHDSHGNRINRGGNKNSGGVH